MRCASAVVVVIAACGGATKSGSGPVENTGPVTAATPSPCAAAVKVLEGNGRSSDDLRGDLEALCTREWPEAYVTCIAARRDDCPPLEGDMAEHASVLGDLTTGHAPPSCFAWARAVARLESCKKPRPDDRRNLSAALHFVAFALSMQDAGGGGVSAADISSANQQCEAAVRRVKATLDATGC